MSLDASVLQRRRGTFGAPPLPAPRGELSAWLFAYLEDGASPSPRPRLTPGAYDSLTDDDFQLSLYCLYELAYRGFHSVDPAMETDPCVVALRSQLGLRFEAALRAEVDPSPAIAGAQVDIEALLARFDGPSLSEHVLKEGNFGRFREFMVHRSAYQLKEADPHSWIIPRIPAGPRKAALLEIQADEYGIGEVGRSHAELFAAAMDAAGLDSTYGAHVHRLPGITLATCNLVSLLGSERRLMGAALGHLATFEMTSVEPMSRYRTAANELGLPAAVAEFYDVHVEADQHHGRLAAEVLIGGDLWTDGIDPAEVAFGAAALIDLEDRFACHLLRRWEGNQSSFFSL